MDKNLIIIIIALVLSVPGLVFVIKRLKFMREHFPDGITQESLDKYRVSVSPNVYRKFLKSMIGSRESLMLADAEKGKNPDEKMGLEIELLKEEQSKYAK